MIFTNDPKYIYIPCVLIDNGVPLVKLLQLQSIPGAAMSTDDLIIHIKYWQWQNMVSGNCLMCPSFRKSWSVLLHQPQSPHMSLVLTLLDWSLQGSIHRAQWILLQDCLWDNRPIHLPFCLFCPHYQVREALGCFH